MYFFRSRFAIRVLKILAILSLIATAVLHFIHNYYHQSSSRGKDEQFPKKSIKGVIDPRQWLQEQDLIGAGPIPCQWVTTSSMKFPVCAYKSADDVFVSSTIQKGGVFQQEDVERLIRLLQSRLPDKTQLVDIGANIGSFVLPVSRVTPVIAVEPNWEKMYRLAMSVVLGNVDENVTLVYSAVSNQRTILNMAFGETNRGYTVMSKNASCAGMPVSGLRCLQKPVGTVHLDDLLPLMTYRQALLKVDTEGHEINIFTEETASVFFHEINIPFILLEWAPGAIQEQNKNNYVQLIERFVSFFRDRGYKVFNTNNKPLPWDWKQWPNHTSDFVLKNEHFANEVV